LKGSKTLVLQFLPDCPQIREDGVVQCSFQVFCAVGACRIEKNTLSFFSILLHYFTKKSFTLI